jgi:hypothetical membrane protein
MEGTAVSGEGGAGGANPLWRAGAYAAASAATGFGGVAVALALAPWFSWSADALSDLGHPRHASAAPFAAGLFMAGIFFVKAVWFARPVLGDSRLASAAVAFLIAGGLSLSAIGVVNVSYGTAHFVVSLTYFAFVPLGMALLALCIRQAAPGFAAVTSLMAAAAAAFGITILTAVAWGAPFSSQAVPELIASAILAAWALAAGAALARGRFPTAP